MLVLLPLATTSSYAEEIPDWIKINAGWWSEGSITDSDFLQGIQFLINEEILVIESVNAAASSKTSEIPDWIKINAGWWSEGSITDDDFVNAIKHLIEIGIITIDDKGDKTTTKTTDDSDPILKSLQEELDVCKSITKAYDRIECQDDVKLRMDIHYYKHNSDVYQVGPVTFYYPGIGTDGNEFFMEGDQPILTIRMLAENSNSNSNVILMCTGPAVCNYDISDGSKTFKYSGMDFTNGQIVLKPGDARVFNMLFGPNIGYGGTQFQYDASKEYVFRISEPWGNAEIPLELK